MTYVQFVENVVTLWKLKPLVYIDNNTVSTSPQIFSKIFAFLNIIFLDILYIGNYVEEG